MTRVFNRLAKQASERPTTLQRRMGIHTMLNVLLSYALEVDAVLTELTKDQQTPAAERLAEAGAQLREDVKLWLGGR